MCRLLAFSFRENTKKEHRIKCISEFRTLADTGMVPKGIEKGHKDGWGLSLYSSGNEIPFVYKTALSADADENLNLGEYLLDAIAQSGLVHIRKKTVGEATPANSHPFVNGAYSFIHNGTVERGPGPYQELAPLCESETDSERLFQHFLKLRQSKDTLQAYTEMLVSTRDTYPTYSALNTMLHDGRRIYVSRVMNTDNPQYVELDLENYYTLYLGKTNDGDALISSQKLDYKDASYILIENNSIVVFDTETGEHQVIPI